MLVDFMAENKPFARGQFTGIHSRQTNGETWDKLSRQLNAQGPIIKSMEKWKKCWTDIRSAAKKRAAEYKAFLNQTGGGSILDDPRPLTEFEEQVISIITIDAVDGDGSTPELGNGIVEHHNYDNLEIELEDEEDDCTPKPSKLRKTQSFGYGNALEEARMLQASIEKKLDDLLKINKEILSRLPKNE